MLTAEEDQLRSALVATRDIQPISQAPLEELSQRLFGETRAAALPPDVIEANNRDSQGAARCLPVLRPRRDVAPSK